MELKEQPTFQPQLVIDLPTERELVVARIRKVEGVQCHQEGDEISIETASGESIKNLLQKGDKIIHDPTKKGGIMGWFRDRTHSHLYLNGDEIVKGREADLAALAHEVGHRSPSNVSTNKGLQVDIYTRLREGIGRLKIEDVVSEICKSFDLWMDYELQAWREGQPISQVLGVSPGVYAIVQRLSLATHYYSALEVVVELLTKYGADKVPDDANLDLFGPQLNGEQVTISYGEFNENMKYIAENNEANRADNMLLTVMSAQ